ncbi:MarR family transcriptional regulator [Halorussus marinus]|uniref:MarR family transcriptional regulator n=1 Tax=Halorussus marinus TaxID=2505976 RepID=UPI0010923A3E|nr:MarR family transcriptional regulator [Halorussus marinus]
MRVSPRWMILLDDRILELISEEGPLIPSKIASDERIPYGSQHVGNRCRVLTNHGLLENIGNGVYVLTDRGKAYLKGERVFTELEVES